MTDPTPEANDTPRPKRRRRSAIRVLRSTAMLPATFTIFNGLCGFGAIHFAAKDGLDAALDSGAILNLQIAAGLLFLAMVCDMLDGRLARMTRSTSDFGAQLDSLCDMISFGTAPAVLVLRSTVYSLRSQMDYLPVERMVWCIAGIYVACAALRLARFNVETDQDESAHMDFRGLPTPAAAASLASMVLLFAAIASGFHKDWAWLAPKNGMIAMSFTLPILMLVCALLMVSRFRYPHLVNQYIRGKRSFNYIVKFVIIVLAAMVKPWLTLAVVVLAYILWAPGKAIWQLVRAKKEPVQQ